MVWQAADQKALAALSNSTIETPPLKLLGHVAFGNVLPAEDKEPGFTILTPSFN